MVVMDVVQNHKQGCGKSIVNNIMDELYGKKYVFKGQTLSSLLSPEHAGNLISRRLIPLRMMRKLVY